MKTKIFTSLIVGIFLAFASCNDKDDPVEAPLTKETFSGYVQKGPFISGSSVAISELDEELNQTGRSYFTTVSDNSGSFEQKQVELISGYVQLKADGYYFNEVSGEASPGQLTLYALADISDASSANVNVLTHLERRRVEYLVQQQGFSFAAAKTQAQQEVLALFNLELPDEAASESLNLTDDGILLAVSCILQGNLSAAGMSELMADIIADIRTDGTLDESSLGSQLIDNARLIDLAAIRRNLEDKYSEPGMGNAAIPEFESYVLKFIEETTYEPKTFIAYPEKGKYDINILADGVNVIDERIFYSLKADLPLGTSLKVVLRNGMWYYGSLPGPENWNVEIYDFATKSQVFTVTQSGVPNDLAIRFEGGEITVEYYENGATTPTRVKQLVVEVEKEENDTSLVAGHWALRQITGGEAPAENFTGDDVIWHFYPKDTLLIYVNKMVSDVSRLPFKESTLFHYTVNKEKLSLYNFRDEQYEFEYSVDENFLRIYDHSASDEVMLEFAKE